MRAVVMASPFHSPAPRRQPRERGVRPDDLTPRGLAPRDGFEPSTQRLTAACSTTELPGIRARLASGASSHRSPVFCGNIDRNRARSDRQASYRTGMRGSASVLGLARSSELDFAVGGRRAPNRCRAGLMGRACDPRPELDRWRGRGRPRLRFGWRLGPRLGQARFQDRTRICGVCIRDPTRLKVAAGDQARG